MRDADAFDGAVFLGLAWDSRRDPYRLALFAKHLDAAEEPRACLAVRGGTLLVTDRRLLEFRAHLEVHGAWNVKEFQGYEVRRQMDRASVRDVEHRCEPPRAGSPELEDTVRLVLPDRVETVVVSRGPEPTLTDEDFARLKHAILDQAK